VLMKGSFCILSLPDCLYLTVA